MNDEKRFAVKLTESQIRAVIVALGEIKLGDIHPVRVRQTHEALHELRETKNDIERGRK